MEHPVHYHLGRSAASSRSHGHPRAHWNILVKRSDFEQRRAMIHSLQPPSLNRYGGGANLHHSASAFVRAPPSRLLIRKPIECSVKIARPIHRSCPARDSRFQKLAAEQWGAEGNWASVRRVFSQATVDTAEVARSVARIEPSLAHRGSFVDHVYSIRKEAATSGGERGVISIYYGCDFTEEREQRRRGVAGPVFFRQWNPEAGPSMPSEGWACFRRCCHRNFLQALSGELLFQ